MLRKYRYEAILAVSIAVLGFGTLATVYALGHWPVSPGLFRFRSATLGDGLLLPLAAGILLRVARSLGGGPDDWKACAVGAGFGAVAGMLVVWQWLRDPAPRFNWTLPQPHDFNAPGWYHSGFLCACCSLFAGLYVLTVIRLRRLRRNDDGRFGLLIISLPWVVAWASLLGFAGLVAVDSSGNPGTAVWASLGALGGAGLTCLVPVLIFAAGYRWTVINAMLLALMLASGVTVLAASRGSVGADVVVLSIVAVGCAVAFAAADPAASVPEAARWRRLETPAAFSIFMVLGVVPALAPHFSILAAAACLIGAAVALTALKAIMISIRKRVEPASAVLSRRLLAYSMTPPWIIMILAVCAVWFSRHTGLNTYLSSAVLLVASVIVVNVLSPMLRSTYDAFVLAEEASTSPSGRVVPVQRMRGRIAAQAVGGLAIAGACALILLTATLAGENSFLPGQNSNPVPPAVTLAAGITLALLAVAAGLSRNRPRRSRAAAALVIVGACLWTSTVASHIAIRGHDWVAVPLTLLLGTWTANSLKTNSGTLERVRTGPLQWAVTALIAVSAASAMLWATTSGLRWHAMPVSLYWSLLPFGIVILVTFTLLCVASLSCFPAPQPDKGTNYGPIAGILQDQGLMTLLALIVIWLPAVTFIHISADARERWIALPLTLFSFMFLVGSIFSWILRYNTRHAAYQIYKIAPSGAWPNRKRYPLVPWQRVRKLQFLTTLTRDGADSLDDREWADAIESNTALQNLLALGMVSIAVIPLLALLRDVLLVPSPD
jgi:hypothetical protein